MALPILDGNQTAATLSTVLTGGEHIPAHTVVSLGSQAITDVSSAVSGSVVSISNFPASQSTTFGAVTGSVSVLNFPSTQTIAGTVTANLANVVTTDAFWQTQAIRITGGDGYGIDIAGLDNTGSRAIFNEGGGIPVYPRDNSGLNAPFPISGTVTANIFGNDAINGGKIAVKLDDEGAVFVKPQAAFEIQKMPSGALTTRFGSVTTANTAQITSAVTNTSRKYLLAQNISAGTVTIGIGFSPTTTQGIQLTAGAGLTFDSFCPTGAVFWLGAVTGAAFTILEG